jgi:hypothetical protein
MVRAAREDLKLVEEALQTSVSRGVEPPLKEMKRRLVRLGIEYSPEHSLIN